MACFVHSILFMVKWLRRMALRDTGFYTNAPMYRVPAVLRQVTPPSPNKAPYPAYLAPENNPNRTQPQPTEAGYRTEPHIGIPGPGSDYERFNCNNFNVRY